MEGDIFCYTVISQAEFSFYGEMAKVTTHFMESDIEEIYMSETHDEKNT